MMSTTARGALCRHNPVMRVPHVLGPSTKSPRITEKNVEYSLWQFSCRTFATVIEEKLAQKQRRKELYEYAEQRLHKLQTRREGRDVGAKKRQFREWYDKIRIYQEIMDRKARQANMDWTIKAAAILERLPVVTPDKPQWEVDYLNLKTYLQQFGKEYPPELGFSPGKGKLAMTDEELLGASCLIHIIVNACISSNSVILI